MPVTRYTFVREPFAQKMKFAFSKKTPAEKSLHIAGLEQYQDTQLYSAGCTVSSFKKLKHQSFGAV